MAICKHCGFEESVKHGRVRGKQRYRCKQCGLHFVIGDERVKENLAAKKAMAVVLYSIAKTSFSMLGKVFGVSRTLTYRWIKEAAETLPEAGVPGDIKEMEFDEMWQLIGSKKTNAESSKHWIVAQGEPWPGLQAVVMLRRFDNSTTK